MASDRSTWGESEWQVHALAMEKRYLDALAGWGEAVAELERITDTNAELRAAIERLHAQSATMGQALQLVGELIEEKDRASSSPRSVGRPRKREPQALLTLYNDLEARYLQQHEVQKAPSVKKVLDWYFTNEFQRMGAGAWRAKDADFRTALRSFEKRISEARTFVRVNFPEKP